LKDPFGITNETEFAPQPTMCKIVFGMCEKAKFKLSKK
jgi:hypothetical protein